MAFIPIAFYEVVLPILLMVGVGYFAGRRFRPDTASLAKIAVHLLMPALTYQSILKSELGAGEVGRYALLMVVNTAVLGLPAWLFIRRWPGLSRPTHSAFILTVTMMNTGNYALPVVEFAYGSGALDYGVIGMITSTALIGTFGVFVASSGTAGVRQGVISVITSPLMLSVVVGLLVRAWQINIPLPIARTIGLLSQATIPIFLIMLGIQLSEVSLRAMQPAKLRAVLTACGVRLVIGPIVLFGLTALFGLGGLARQVAIVQMGMPTAVNVSLLAEEYKSDREFVSASILISTLGSLLTLSVLLSLI